FGLAPALRATRPGAMPATMAAGRGVTDTRERFGLRRVLVVVQVAMSLVLVTGSLLFVQTFRNLAKLDAGFRRDGLLIVHADFRNTGLPPSQAVQAFTEICRRIRGVAGIDAVALSNIVPVGGDGWNDNVLTEHGGDGKSKEVVNFDEVSTGFFETLGTPLLAGRDFVEYDTPESPKVAIVNQTFARMVLGSGNPIDRT